MRARRLWITLWVFCWQVACSRVPLQRRTGPTPGAGQFPNAIQGLEANSALQLTGIASALFLEPLLWTKIRRGMRHARAQFIEEIPPRGVPADRVE
jgi:hypothetical protein